MDPSDVTPWSDDRSSMIEARRNGMKVPEPAPQPYQTFTQNVKDMKRSAFGEIVKYKQVKKIGAGGFGNCFLLERQTDKALRVCKVQAREKSDDTNNYEDEPIEVRILWDILPRNARILCLQNFIVQTHTIQLYYDYYEGGDLEKLIDRYFDQWEEIPETFLWHAYLQLSEALAFIHHGYDKCLASLPNDWISVIHGDIKDRNIFLGPPDPGSSDPLAREYPSLILGDFGLADLRESKSWGTPAWQPPELPVNSMKADVWAVGAVLHALAHEGNPPIAPLGEGAASKDWNAWCENPLSRDPIPLLGTYSNELHDCVSNALEFDSTNRYNSYKLYFTVLGTWTTNILPFCNEITPLLGPAVDKSYDENGVTMSRNHRESNLEQQLAATDAIEVQMSFEEEMATTQSPNTTNNEVPVLTTTMDTVKFQDALAAIQHEAMIFHERDGKASAYGVCMR